MNTPHAYRNTTDQIIDHALQQLAAVEPQPGMNDRILRSLRQAQPAPRAALGWPRLAFAGLAGCCLCSVVVLGSVQHSRNVAAQHRPIIPILQQQSGISTASSARIAAQPPVAPTGSGRSNQHLGQGRASVKPGTHVRAGDGISLPPHHP